jgi:beta-lactamase regulating signal transducer with metallopeptidase domain
LLNSLWQGALLTAAVWCSLRLSRRTNAATRYLTWWFLLAAMALLPVLNIVFFSAPQGRREDSREFASLQDAPVPAPLYPDTSTTDAGEAESLAGESTQPVLESPGDSGTDNPAEVGRPASVFPQPLLHLTSGVSPFPILLVWGLGASAIGGRLFRNYLRLLMLRRRSRLCPAEWEGRWHRLKTRLGLRRPVSFRVSEEVSLPLAAGFARPFVLMPNSLAPDLSEDDVERVAVHELAHLRRYDDWTQMVQQVLEALLFFHPATWFVSRRLALEREIACDDWVIHVTGQPRPYALCLTRLAERSAQPGCAALVPGFVRNRPHISRRIEMLLKRPRNQTPRLLKAGFVGLLCLGLAVGFLTLRMAPRVVLAEAPSGEAQSAAMSVDTLTPDADAAVQQQNAAQSNSTAAPPPASKSNPQQSETKPQKAEPEVVKDVDRRRDDVKRQLEYALQEQLRHADTITAQAAEHAHQAVLAAASQEELHTHLQDVEEDLAEQAELLTELAEGGKPILSEQELLPFLRDIARTDKSPAVQRSAILGIGRMRTDASVDTLLALFDQVADVKAKRAILSNLVRRKGDNAKAAAKLTEVARSGAALELREEAFRQLMRVNDDDGAAALIAIYDSTQDKKTKGSLLRALSRSRARKAADKLMAAARTESDEELRLQAVRALAGGREPMAEYLSDVYAPPAVAATPAPPPPPPARPPGK